MPENAFRKFLSILTERGAGVVGRLAPGREIGDAFDDVTDLDLHPDLAVMWREMNGIAESEGELLEDLWLDGQYMPFSITEAREDYQITLNLVAEDPEMESYFPTGFVPVATPGDGSRLLVNCRKGSPTHGHVYELMHGVGVTRMAPSLSAHFETLCAFITEGALTVNDQGQVEPDFDLVREIGKRLNPGCDGYDDDLPPANETMEWR